MDRLGQLGQYALSMMIYHRILCESGHLKLL
jgi:hypothetical protein